MLCSQWWAFEFLTIFASLVSTEAVAAQAVIMQESATIDYERAVPVKANYTPMEQGPVDLPY